MGGPFTKLEPFSIMVVSRPNSAKRKAMVDPATPPPSIAILAFELNTGELDINFLFITIKMYFFMTNILLIYTCIAKS
jgi:hypothetical protein